MPRRSREARDHDVMKSIIGILIPVVFLAATATVTGPAAADLEYLDDEVRVAESLEQAIRDSEKLSLMTKMSIQDRYNELEDAAEGYRRGDVPEYDLREIFDAAMIWLENLFAQSDPRLRTQLVLARPALWKIATGE